MDALVVASYNVHGGVDGYGRPFDVVAGCRALDADLLVLQETWSPDGGEPLAGRVADALGYRVEELAMARGRVSAPSDEAKAPRSWGPVVRPRGPYGLQVGERQTRAQQAPSSGKVEEGTWGLAVLSRVPLESTAVLDLGKLYRDPAQRGAIAVEVDVGRRIRVIGTHLSHLSHGSIIQLGALRRLIADPDTPSVLTGDMNMWGPPLSAFLPGWSRVVLGRTWPAWRPVAQLDHILVTGGVETRGDGQVMALRGSDHLPVRARITAS